MQNFDEHLPGQPLIRKHSDLDHTRRYMGRFNFVLWHQGPIPGMGLDGAKVHAPCGLEGQKVKF